MASRLRKATSASARIERPRPSEANALSVAPHHLLSLFLAKDLEALIDVVFQVVSASVGCDFVSAVYRNVGDGLLRERDSRGRDYDSAFMRRYAELTPAIPLVLANPGITTLTTRAGLSGPARELRRTAFYREIMRPQGWRHGVSLCFWGEQPGNLPILVAVAYRREGQRDFSERDVRTLQHSHPFIDGAVNRIYEREAETTLHDGIQMAARSGALGCAILDRNLLPVVVNGAAAQLCAAWLNDGAPADEDFSLDAWRLPPALVAACQSLQKEWHKFLRDEHRAMNLRDHRRVIHPRAPELTALITIIRPAITGFAEPMFVVELDRRVHGAPLNTPDLSVSLLPQMTAAERAVAMVLADGFSNQEIADRLGKSVQAVKFLLHRIYEKSGIPNRAALVAVLRSRQNSRKRSPGTARRRVQPGRR